MAPYGAHRRTRATPPAPKGRFPGVNGRFAGLNGGYCGMRREMLVPAPGALRTLNP